MNSTDLLPSGHRRINLTEMVGITRRFPGVVANRNVNFDVKAGEIHALLGENGAGKSTLMNQLGGLYVPDEGEIRLDGRRVDIRTPSQALKLGIGMIHQHFMLVPTLTVTENIALSRHGGVLLELDSVREELVAVSETYNLDINPDAAVWQMSLGEMKRLEIIKALFHGGSIIILDEPTAVLTPREVEDLFQTLNLMRSRGHSLVFITHKLHEVQLISDRITVMRDGEVIETIPNEGVEQRTLAHMMVGRELRLHLDKPEQVAGEEKLRVRNLSVQNDYDLPALRGINLAVRAGEILGIAAVSGNGQNELAECIAGLRPATGGEVLLDGDSILHLSIGDRLQAGLSYVPEERTVHGTIGTFSVAENVILQKHGSSRFRSGLFMNFAAIADFTEELLTRFSIRPQRKEVLVKNLSGGNAQKVMLARELSHEPTAMVVERPTHGVDVGATEFIRELMLQKRSEGVAILLISEDLDEIMALSDRIAVIYEGNVVDVVDREDAVADNLGLLMAGGVG